MCLIIRCRFARLHSKNNPYFSCHCYFRREGETGGERDLVIFEDKPINNHINEMVSSRALYEYSYS